MPLTGRNMRTVWIGQFTDNITRVGSCRTELDGLWYVKTADKHND